MRFILPLAAALFLCGSGHAQTNSGKLIFADEAGRLYLINADGTGQTMITSQTHGQDNHPAFSPDGSKIAFSRTQGRTNIYVMNADGTNPVAITSDSPVLDTFFNSDPTWSPDGTKIAFMSDLNGARRCEIWVIKVDGTGLTQLTTNVQLSTDGQGPVFSSDTNPAWSPDGSRIAFASNRDGLANSEIYVMNADGTNPTRVTNVANDDRFPTWSPDSQKIAFYRNGGSGIGINIVNRDGTNELNITHDGFMPEWSPDGLRLVFQQLDPDIGFKPAVFIIKVNGTNKFKVTNNSFGSSAAAWAPSSSPPVPTFKISGLVRDGNGAPVSGATLNLLGTFPNTLENFLSNTQTDATGAYSFTGLPTANYKIDISRSGFGFVPKTINLTNVNADQTVNFTAFVAFSIRGQVNGLGGNGIWVSLNGAETRTVVTDSGGHYSFDILRAGENYTLSIFTKFWNISPNNLTFNSLSANQIVNFEATPAFYTISGAITRLGIPKPGVTVALQDTSGFAPPTTVTDSNGQYSFTNVRSQRTYFVRPLAANYVFQPQTRDFNPLDGNKTADFVALSANHVLFSQSNFTVTEGNVNLQVFVARGGNATGVGPITVDYTTVTGTATAGSDYTPAGGTLSFPEGTFSRVITIPILNDQLSEGPEQLTIRLSNPTGEVDLGTLSSATVTIADNEVPPTIKLATGINSDGAIALNGTSMVATPFTPATPFFSPDVRTRILLFVENLQATASQITVDAEDAQQNHYQLQLEGVEKVPGENPYSQLTVRLPDNFSSGDLFIRITVNGQLSNKVRISIQP